MTDRAQQMLQLVSDATRDDRVAFGQRLRARRLELGLSQEGLAHKACSDRQSIMRLETARHVPGLHRAIFYARALGTTLGALLGEPVGAGQKVWRTTHTMTGSIHASREGALDAVAAHGLSRKDAEHFVQELEVRP
jgi:transcriptional regulator with XRE-family HTH domain